MLKEARFSTILEAVSERKYVSLRTLMELTQSSESTIRADLIELDRMGKLLRLRGGAQALNDASISYELSIEEKMAIQLPAKRAIAEKAASLVRTGQMIYVDAGTSTYAFIDALEVPGIKIVTDSYFIAKKAHQKGYTTYVIGGEFKASTDAFIGPMAQEILNRFRFDVGFFGTNGIDLKQGFTTPDVEEAAIKMKAMSQCDSLYVLADNSKFDVVTAVRFHPFEGNILITDEITKPHYQGLGILEASK